MDVRNRGGDQSHKQMDELARAQGNNFVPASDHVHNPTFSLNKTQHG